jgi:hypothetical protein
MITSTTINSIRVKLILRTLTLRPADFTEIMGTEGCRRFESVRSGTSGVIVTNYSRVIDNQTELLRSLTSSTGCAFNPHHHSMVTRSQHFRGWTPQPRLAAAVARRPAGLGAGGRQRTAVKGMRLTAARTPMSAPPPPVQLTTADRLQSRGAPRHALIQPYQYSLASRFSRFRASSVAVQGGA